MVLLVCLVTTRLDKAMETFATQIAAASAGPTIVVEDPPGPTVNVSGSLYQTPPELPDGPSVPAAINYMFYDLSYGPVF